MLTFQKYVHFMRTQFPPGSRVLLLSNDQPKPVPDGTMGTLTEIDSAGRFLVNWDNGKRTALNLEDDHFRIFQSEPMELKLYFPLHGDLYTRNEWGDLAGNSLTLEQTRAILDAVNPPEHFPQDGENYPASEDETPHQTM